MLILVSLFAVTAIIEGTAKKVDDLEENHLHY